MVEGGNDLFFFHMRCFAFFRCLPDCLPEKKKKFFAPQIVAFRTSRGFPSILFKYSRNESLGHHATPKVCNSGLEQL